MLNHLSIIAILIKHDRNTKFNILSNIVYRTFNDPIRTTADRKENAKTKNQKLDVIQDMGYNKYN